MELLPSAPHGGVKDQTEAALILHNALVGSLMELVEVADSTQPVLPSSQHHSLVESQWDTVDESPSKDDAWFLGRGGHDAI
jgi:hypothetical protein